MKTRDITAGAYGLSPPLIAGAVDMAGFAMPCCRGAAAALPFMLPLSITALCMALVLPVALRCIAVWRRVMWCRCA